MGQCVEKICHDVPECGSRRGLQVFINDEGEYNGYCYVCNTFVPDPYHDKPEGYKPEAKVKSDEEIREEIEEILECDAQTLHERKLNKSTLEHFNVKVGVSGEDGVTPASVHFPYCKEGELQGYKNRLLENKSMWSVGKVKGAELFGWEQAKATGAKKLFITEGEYDALALYQIITRQQEGTEWAGQAPAVVSLTRGAGCAVEDITRNMDKIRQYFKEVVLVFDQDKPGQDAAAAVVVIAPDFYVASLPAKDANECLLEGHNKACFNAVMFNAKRPKNSRIVWGDDLHEEAKEPAKEGELSWPWEGMNKLTRRIRLGETIYLGAGVKMGKSELLNAIAAHLIKEHGIKCFMAKPEEANKKTYKLLAGKCVGKVFHDPNVAFDADAFDEAGEMLRGKVAMMNLYQNITWEVLKADIRAAAVEGCKAVFIDPITNLTNGMESGEANVKLQEIAQELAAMAMDLNIVIFIFCHLKAPDQGAIHERGGAVLSTQFAGSRAMMRSCNYMIGLEGNKNPELSKDERNMRSLVLLEDREFGEVGRVSLYWQAQTSLFQEV